MGDTPLHLAAAHDHLDVLAVLLQAGANCDVRNKDGHTCEKLGSDRVANLVRLSRARHTVPASYNAEDYFDDSD